jgi:putative oxidoreductase
LQFREPGESSPAVNRSSAMQSLNALLGRVGLSLIFIISGFGKIAAYAGTEQYMAAAGVPGALLPLVIALELGGGLAILAGAFTRSTAIVLALFSVVSAILFHANLGDQNQFIHLLKNIAIAGGFLTLAAHGPGSISIDALWRKSTSARHVTA